VTGVEVVVENFGPEVREMLPEIEKAVTTSLLRVYRATVRGQQCVFVNVTWRDLDQSRAGILRWYI